MRGILGMLFVWSPGKTRLYLDESGRPLAGSMWDHIMATDLTAEVAKLDIPVYFFHGLHDYTVSYTLAKDYLEKLRAPLKGFYTFERSDHSPIFEEPEKMRRVLQEDVLAGVNNLADKK